MSDLGQSIEASRAVLAHLSVPDSPTRSPLYAAIAREAVGDDEVLVLIAGPAGAKVRRAAR